MNRRGFIFGAAAFSIVRPEILMPIKQIITTVDTALPPGVYTMRVEKVYLDNGKMIMKMLRHGLNYSMGPDQARNMITARMKIK